MEVTNEFIKQLIRINIYRIYMLMFTDRKHGGTPRNEGGAVQVCEQQGDGRRGVHGV